MRPWGDTEHATHTRTYTQTQTIYAYYKMYYGISRSRMCVKHGEIMVKWVTALICVYFCAFAWRTIVCAFNGMWIFYYVFCRVFVLVRDWNFQIDEKWNVLNGVWRFSKRSFVIFRRAYVNFRLIEAFGYECKNMYSDVIWIVLYFIMNNYTLI